MVDGYVNVVLGIGVFEVMLMLSVIFVEVGVIINIGFSFGNLSQFLESFYGIVFVMSYDNDLVEFIIGFEYDDLDNFWINVDGVEIEDVFYKDELEGCLEFVLICINQMIISGSGQVVEFSIIIEDIIVGLIVDIFCLCIDSVLFIDNNFKCIFVVLDMVIIIIVDDIMKLSGICELLIFLAWVFFNLVSGQCYFKFFYLFSFLKLVDVYGYVIW